MSSEPARSAPRTYEEYLAVERASEAKNEFVDGELSAMSGAKKAHNLVAVNLMTTLANALADRPCLVFNSDMRVKTGNARGTYPDVSALCGEPRFSDDEEDELLNPSVIIEVLSPTTEAYDRGEKFDHYRTIESLRTYVLVSAVRQHIDMFQRADGGDWSFHAYGPGESFPVPPLDCSIAVEDAYRKVHLAG